MISLKDPDEIVIERAKTYIHSTESYRAMQFAYFCVFGLKEPIYSAYHLAKCDPKTLLMLRSDSQHKMLLLQQVLGEEDDWIFEVTWQV